jgi:hypothetical protein
MLRMLLHHGLGIATAWSATMLVRELVLLVWRAVVRLMGLRIWSTHGCHCGS